jgi:hypothetical protein
MHKNHHFVQKIPSDMIKGMFWKISRKTTKFQKKKVMKLLRFLEDFGRFITYFF